MAVKWSWAFGQETGTQLNDDMGWQLTSNLANYVPSTTYTYTYAGSPARQSLRVQSGYDFVLPVSTFTPTGWLTMAAYNDAALWTQNTYMLLATGGNSRFIGIYMASSASSTFHLLVDNQFKEAFTVALNDWHYWALKFDMSTASWSGQVYLNGLPVTAAYTDAGIAQTVGTFKSEGFSSGATTYFAQFTVYDDLLDAGETPLFVTRISPDSDSSEVGTWTPTGGPATNHDATNSDPFNPATYTEETTPNSGDNVVTSFTTDIAGQLGVSPSAVLGITTHAYASGTAISSFAATGAAGAFQNGSTFVPDLADTTYGYSTAPINPSTAVAWLGTDTVQTKFEIV